MSVTHPDARHLAVEYTDTGRVSRVSARPDPAAGVVDSELLFTWSADGARLESLEQPPIAQLLSDGSARPRVTLSPSRSGTLATGLIEEVDSGAGVAVMSMAVAHDPVTWRPASYTISDGFGTSHAVGLAWDDDGLPTGIGGLALTNAGRGVGLPTLAALGQTTVNRTWSAFGELEMQHMAHGGSTRHRITLGRVPAGTLTSIEDCFGDGFNPLGCVNWTYTYDARGRLASATSDEPTPRSYQYTYDPRGNRMSFASHLGVETVAPGAYDDQDRQLSYNGATFTYNAMGQRTGVTGGPFGDWTYTYDVRGNLLRAQGPNADVEYVVDGQDRRIGRRVNAGLWTWWFYAGRLTPVAEFDDQFRLRKVFVYGVHAHVPDHMIIYDENGNGGQAYRFVTDQIGSVRGVLYPDGDWLERVEYSPFGRREVLDAAPPAAAHPFGFAGGLRDDATHLVRFGARDYDPWVGRWTAKDPIRFEGGTSNLYEYSYSNPAVFSDPSGFYPLSDVYSRLLNDAIVMGTYQVVFDAWWPFRKYRRWGPIQNNYNALFEERGEGPVCADYAEDFASFLNQHSRFEGYRAVARMTFMEKGGTVPASPTAGMERMSPGVHYETYIVRDGPNGGRLEFIGKFDPWTRFPGLQVGVPDKSDYQRLMRVLP